MVSKALLQLIFHESLHFLILFVDYFFSWRINSVRNIQNLAIQYCLPSFRQTLCCIAQSCIMTRCILKIMHSFLFSSFFLIPMLLHHYFVIVVVAWRNKTEIHNGRFYNNSNLIIYNNS